MRILICSLDAPIPPVNGFRLYLMALIRELRKDHEVRVLAFRSHDQGGDPADDIDARLIPRPSITMLGKALTFPRALVYRRPLGVSELAASIRGPLHEELARFRPDVVHVSTQELALLGHDLAGRPSVLAALDAWYLNVRADIGVARGLRRILLRRQLAWVRRFEGTEMGSFGRVLVVSDEDRGALEELDPALRIEVIPNGVDVDRFSARETTVASESHPEMDSDRVVFTGVMRYSPNVATAEFLARRVMPKVQARWPAAHLAIVGRDPSPAVALLGGLPGVDVVGTVPDLRPWLWGSRVFACPMVSGTGIKNKLLEAMAAGVACVATPLAVRGIHAVPGHHVLLGSDADELATQIVRVLGDEGLARSLGVAAQEYVRTAHGWASVARSYERVYADVLARASAD